MRALSFWMESGTPGAPMLLVEILGVSILGVLKPYTPSRTAEIFLVKV